jgi:methyl-accepting chemotaxis protein
MPDPRFPILQRLVGRVLLLGVLPALTIVSIVVVATIVRAGELIDRDARTAATTAAAIVAGELSTSDAGVEAAAMGLALAVGCIESDGAGPQPSPALAESVERLLRATLDATPDARAAAIAVGTIRLELRRDATAPGGFRLGPLDQMIDADLARELRAASAGSERRGRPLTRLAARPNAPETAAVLTALPVVDAPIGRGFVLIERSPHALVARLEATALRHSATVTLALGEDHLVHAARSAEREPGARGATTIMPLAGSPLERLLLTHIDAPGEVRCERTANGFVAVARVRSDGWAIAAEPTAGDFGRELQATLLANSGAAIVGVLAVAAVMVVLARGVGRRLDTALAAARRIADGDLQETCPEVDAPDESGALIGALGAMTDNLNRIVGQVRHASIRINSTATELAASSVRLESTASGFGASATEVAAATRAISTTGEDLLHTMQAVADSAAGAAEKAQESREGLHSMQQSVHRLDAAADSVATRLSTINEKAQAINAIVGTITKVAEETNLLSVNAAIEAEKAGEFGLGFLIVAREIRRLADQTASATLDIERMIRQMQSAVSAGVGEMDRFGESLRAVLDDVDRVGQRVQGIIAHVEDDTIRFVQVTEGMRSQTVGARQIDEAMRALSSGARQTIESAGEFGAASGELQGAIQSLKSAIGLMRLREGS